MIPNIFRKVLALRSSILVRCIWECYASSFSLDGWDLHCTVKAPRLSAAAAAIKLVARDFARLIATSKP